MRRGRDWDFSGSNACDCPPALPAIRSARPDRATTFARQTKTPDLDEARGARIAQGSGQPPMRLTPRLTMVKTARRALCIITDCLLSVTARLANPASAPYCLGSTQTAHNTCITSTCESQPPRGGFLRDSGQGRVLVNINCSWRVVVGVLVAVARMMLVPLKGARGATFRCGDGPGWQSRSPRPPRRRLKPSGCPKIGSPVNGAECYHRLGQPWPIFYAEIVARLAAAGKRRPTASATAAMRGIRSANCSKVSDCAPSERA